MACVDWLMMWHSCMSREVPLVGHTNISIDDAYTMECLVYNLTTIWHKYLKLQSSQIKFVIKREQ
jgi:hypothetical protein